ncbi:DNA-binding response OmpR family regulator [Bacillus sp. SORGH_AS 510]|uniref:response regulator transcription factor n=1 Tax=Bacillus sp. SORGH_AS_0510 TaxID=3041771 RepID=UPI00277DBA07|nr:response regulator transcription factor [Bacillus sp. SORGH_AS_0510]MDQ1143864.1 DNA-binding response OmpR family regulator [Bacillus sp. SORGH_AS_0510]
MRTEKILLVDDEVGILNMLELVLKKEQFHQLHKAMTGKESIELVKEIKFDLILLDVMLPDRDGYELCREIRNYTNAPIVFLTARSSDLDILTGLGIGGDDYITKPFNPLEVVARINAHLRRQKLLSKTQNDSKTDGIWKFQTFTLFEKEGRIEVNGNSLSFTAKEFELLLFFCKNKNQIFTAEQLYEKVWGEEVYGDVKTVVMYVSKLRKKIEKDYKNPKYVLNIRGLGYIFVPHYLSETK